MNLHQVVWPGQLDGLEKSMILLDGAHNPHAVVPLIARIFETFLKSKTILFTCIGQSLRRDAHSVAGTRNSHDHTTEKIRAYSQKR